MKCRRCRPTMGKSACEGMGAVAIKDSDAIWRPLIILYNVNRTKLSTSDLFFNSNVCPFKLENQMVVFAYIREIVALKQVAIFTL